MVMVMAMAAIIVMVMVMAMIPLACKMCHKSLLPTLFCQLFIICCKGFKHGTAHPHLHLRVNHHGVFSSTSFA